MEGRSLYTILSDYTKPQLEDLRDLLGEPGLRNRSKAGLVEELYGYLRGEPRRWLSRLTERDLRQLRELVHAGPDKVKIQALSSYPTLLEAAGLVSTDDTDENTHKVWIGPELYDIVRKDVDEVLHAGEQSGRFELERMGIGYLNLCGVVPVDRLLTVVADCYCQKYRRANRNKVIKDIFNSPWYKLYHCIDENGEYLASPCLNAPEELFPIRNAMGAHHYAEDFTADRLYESGCGAPYFSVGMKTPQGLRLEAMYRRVGYTGFDLTLALHDTWVESQYTSQPNEELFGPLMDSPLASQLDRESWMSCVQIVADYANSVPKWFLCGKTAAEEGKGLVDIGPEENAETPSNSQEYPNMWTMPEPTISEGYASEMFYEDYPLGFAIPHVAPDDPCPCGSGLRYCRCHGRYLS